LRDKLTADGLPATVTLKEAAGEAVKSAHEAVRAEESKDAAKKGNGRDALGRVVFAGEAILGQVGDSRIYAGGKSNCGN